MRPIYNWAPLRTRSFPFHQLLHPVLLCRPRRLSGHGDLALSGLTVEQVAERTGWSPERIRQTINPDVRHPDP